MKPYEPMPGTGKLIQSGLDMETADIFLANVYKKGLAEWKETHPGSQYPIAYHKQKTPGRCIPDVFLFVAVTIPAQVQGLVA